MESCSRKRQQVAFNNNNNKQAFPVSKSSLCVIGALGLSHGRFPRLVEQSKSVLCLEAASSKPRKSFPNVFSDDDPNNN